MAAAKPAAVERKEFDAVYALGADALFEVISGLQARITELEGRLGQSSRNSSRSPSSDGPEVPKRRPRKGSGKKQGGQAGRKGAHRELSPDPDEIVDHHPAGCSCGHEFSGSEEPSGKPARHQVAELPATAVVTTEHRLHRLRCPACGRFVRAGLPAGVERGAFGPKLRAAIVTMASMLLSRRAVKLIMAEMFGLAISTGSVEKILKDAGGALAGPWEAIKRAVQSAEVAHADETSWRRAGERIWLWSALSATAACFQIDPSRARRVAEDLLGDFAGILVSDRYSVYDMIDPERRQICLAHLRRNLEAFAERDGAVAAHGRRIAGLLGEIMVAARELGAAGESLDWCTGSLAPLHDRLLDAVEAGERSRDPKLSKLCAGLLDLWPALWSFSENTGVDATNNRAERAIRHAVIWRKVSGGTQIPDGERFVERLLSVRETCRIQQRSLHAYLVEVHQARLSRSAIPVPLPAAA